MQYKPKISVIIPVLNEAQILVKNIIFFTNNNDMEIIFVDGGSEDQTVNLIEQYQFKLIQSPIAKRSYQMNLGAKSAQGNILLFLHGDTILPSNYAELIFNTLANKKMIAGAFVLKIDSSEPAFRFLEKLINFRANFLQLPYGDQGIFITKEIFEQINGYADLAIMEDFNLIQRLKKLGKIKIIDTPVITSARRWQKLGILKTTLINQLIIIGYYFGIDSHKLANFYRQMKKFSSFE